MAAKLKSISSQIHWSLLLRAFIFAAAWFLFPFWLFLIAALYLYLFPLFQVGKLLVPFLVLLILAFIQPPSLIFLVIFCALFYCLLLIKDLILIDRRSAYELLVITLSFFLFRDFYARMGSSLNGAALWYAFLAAAAFGVMVGGFIKAFSQEVSSERASLRRVAGWFSFLLAWQFLVLGLIMPLDFIYQSIIIFVVLVLVLDLVSDRYFGAISRQKLIAASTTMFALLAIVLASARWQL